MMQYGQWNFFFMIFKMYFSEYVVTLNVVGNIRILEAKKKVPKKKLISQLTIICLNYVKQDP